MPFSSENLVFDSALLFQASTAKYEDRSSDAEQEAKVDGYLPDGFFLEPYRGPGEERSERKPHQPTQVAPETGLHVYLAVYPRKKAGAQTHQNPPKLLNL